MRCCDYGHTRRISNGKNEGLVSRQKACFTVLLMSREAGLKHGQLAPRGETSEGQAGSPTGKSGATLMLCSVALSYELTLSEQGLLTKPFAIG